MLLRITLIAALCFWTQCIAEVEIITEPRSGEEYVFVSGGQPQELKQTKSKGRNDHHFETSHKIPEKLPTHHVSRESEEKSEKYSKTKSKLEKTEYSHSPVIDALRSGHVVPSLNMKREVSEGIIEIEEDKRAIRKDSKKKASGLPIKSSEIEIDVPLSKIENIKISEKSLNTETNAQMDVELEPMSQSGKLIGSLDVTTQKPVLTTGAPSTPRSFDVLPVNLGSADSINSGLYADLNVPLEVAGTEQKQHSRIQIKKGPNGQEYEYEYVYYYYDDDEEASNSSSSGKKTTEASTPVLNSHDGPQNNVATNQIKATNSRSKNKYNSIDRVSSTTTTTTNAPENNEVLPGSRSRYRGRNLPPAPSDNETTDERSRNLSTTPSIHDKTDDEIVEKPTRHKSRNHSDNNAEDNVGQTKSRSRANVRRPSLDLVDSASFNTHASDVSVSQYKEIRSRVNSVDDKGGEKSHKSSASETTSRRKNERVTEQTKPVEESSEEDYERETSDSSDSQNTSDLTKEDAESADSVTEVQEKDTTEFTTMAAMDKVALELYAILAGENLKNEISSSDEDLESITETDDMDMTTTDLTTTTEDITTTTPTTTTTEPTTTTTTTTTTTPAPTTTQRGSHFKLRGGARGRTSSTTVTESTPAPATPKPARRFGNSRPSFGRGRVSSTSAPEPAQEGTITKEEAVPVNNKPSLTRSRFGGRGRPTRTTSTAAPAEDSSPSTEASVGSRLRPRPALKPRGRRPLPGATSTTASSISDQEPSDALSEGSSVESSSTTVKSVLGRGRLVNSIRPIRPGPRLAIGGRPGLAAGSPVSSTSTEASSSTASAPEPKESNGDQGEITTQQPGESTVGSALTRLRGRPRLQVAAARPRSAPAPTPRRPSPLLARRRTQEQENVESASTSTETSTSNEPSDSAQEGSTGSSENGPEEEVASEEPATEAPRGLSSLLAGRRRLTNRKPGTIL